MQGVAEWQHQALAGQLQEVMVGLPRRRRQVVSGLTAELEDVEIIVDQHAGRGVLIEHDGVCRTLPLQRRGGRRSLLNVGGLPFEIVPVLEVRIWPQPGRLLHIDARFGSTTPNRLSNEPTVSEVPSKRNPLGFKA